MKHVQMKAKETKGMQSCARYVGWRTSSSVTSMGADVMHTLFRDKSRVTSGMDQGCRGLSGTDL